MPWKNQKAKYNDDYLTFRFIYYHSVGWWIRGARDCRRRQCSFVELFWWNWKLNRCDSQRNSKWREPETKDGQTIGPKQKAWYDQPTGWFPTSAKVNRFNSYVSLYGRPTGWKWGNVAPGRGVSGQDMSWVLSRHSVRRLIRKSRKSRVSTLIAPLVSESRETNFCLSRSPPRI